MNPIELFRMITTPPLRRLAPDADDIRAARRLHQLARRERDLGRIERAEKLAMRALKTLEQYASASHPEVTAVLATLVGIRARRKTEELSA